VWHINIHQINDFLRKKCYITHHRHGCGKGKRSDTNCDWCARFTGPFRCPTLASVAPSSSLLRSGSSFLVHGPARHRSQAHCHTRPNLDGPWVVHERRCAYLVPPY
jgi:hypothetical protein